MVTRWLRFTYYRTERTRQASQTGDGLSYKLSQCALRITTSYSPLSANKPHLESRLEFYSEEAMQDTQEYLADGECIVS